MRSKGLPRGNTKCWTLPTLVIEATKTYFWLIETQRRCFCSMLCRSSVFCRAFSSPKVYTVMWQFAFSLQKECVFFTFTLSSTILWLNNSDHFHCVVTIGYLPPPNNDNSYWSSLLWCACVRVSLASLRRLHFFHYLSANTIDGI